MIQLIVTAFLIGICSVFFEVAGHAYLPLIIDRDRLAEGNTKIQISVSLAFLIAPLFSGKITQLAEGNATIAIGIGYLATIIFFLRIRKVEPLYFRNTHKHIYAEMVEGLRFVFQNPGIRALTLFGTAAGFFIGMQNAMLVLFLIDDLHLSGSTVGVVLAIDSLGSVAGAATIGWWSNVFGSVRVTWLALLTTLPCGLLLPLAQGNLAITLTVIGLLIPTYGIMLHDIIHISLRQALCPDQLLGRTTASMRFMLWSTRPLGALIGGAFGELLGARGVLWIATAGMLVALPWLICSPLRAMRDIPTAPNSL